MDKLLFVINPKAGKTTIKDDLFNIIEIFSKAGYRVEVYPTKGPGDAEKYVEKSGRKYDLIVCAGGDGTLDNTVTGILKLEKKIHTRIPVGYIPCGTTNDLARSLKISRNPVDAALGIVNGDACEMDIGSLGEKFFVYVAAFGVFTDVSYNTSQKLKNILGHSAYVLEAFKNITNMKTYNINAEFDDKTVTGEYIYGQISNSLSVGGFRAIGTKHMSFCDGKFECLLIRKPQNPAELSRILYSIVTNEMDDELIFYEKAKRIVIESDVEIPWALDGEYGGEYLKSEIINNQKAFSIMLWDKSTYNSGKTEDES